MRRVLWTLIALLSALVAPAQAQWNPTRPIKIVVPYPPGGASDAAARTLSERVSLKLGQPVVVENRAGAGGTLARMLFFAPSRTAIHCCSAPLTRFRSPPICSPR